MKKIAAIFLSMIMVASLCTAMISTAYADEPHVQADSTDVESTSAETTDVEEPNTQDDSTDDENMSTETMDVEEPNTQDDSTDDENMSTETTDVEESNTQDDSTDDENTSIETTDSDNLEGIVSIAEFINHITNFATNGNPSSIFGGKLITTSLSLLIGDEKETISTDQLFAQMQQMGEQMSKNHRELMNAIQALSLQGKIVQYHTAMNTLNSNRPIVRAAMSSKNEKELMEKASKGDEEAKATLQDYYSTIVYRCNQAELLKAYNEAVGFFTTSTPASEKPFLAVYDMMKLKTEDGDKFYSEYKQYIEDNISQIGMAYLDVTTYLKAEERYARMTGNIETITDTEKQIQLAHENLQNCVKEYNNALKKLASIKVASVKVDGGNTTTYHTFAAAWRETTKNLSNRKNVTLTIYQDIIAGENGFIDANLTEGEKKGCFSSAGELLVNGNAKLTIDLNGHKISANNKPIIIFDLAEYADLTINGTTGQTEGLCDGKYAIRYSPESVCSGSITLNNVWMNHFTENGIYTTSKLKYNGGGISNAKNGGILFDGRNITFEISNCRFTNNTTDKSGGAIGIKDTDTSISDSSINSCTFENNTAKKYGGAVCLYLAHTNCTIENCTFNTNSAKFGGALGHVNSVKNCTFNKNNAEYGGAASHCRDFDGCEFENNTAVKGSGAYDKSSGGGKISNSKFINNHTQGNGGAIRQDNSELELENCIFTNNSAQGNGGAVANEKENDTVKLKDCTFTGNSAGKDGGALNTASSNDVIAINCTFTGNLAGNTGGALCLSQCLSADHSFTDVTIQNNTAGNAGGGVYCRKSGLKCADIQVKGIVIITDNTANKKQNNVFLEQAQGVKKCTLKERGLNTAKSRIGISTDSKDSKVVVSGVSSGSCYFGDNNRGMTKKGSNMYINALQGGCK